METSDCSASFIFQTRSHPGIFPPHPPDPFLDKPCSEQAEDETRPRALTEPHQPPPHEGFTPLLLVFPSILTSICWTDGETGKTSPSRQLPAENARKPASESL